MFYLIITILLNVIISVLFKLFPRYKIDALQAIVVNYLVCVATGSIFIGEVPLNSTNLAAPWLPWAVTLGVTFIALFYLIAYNTRTHGITTATIANKLSLVIPVLFSFVLYRESVSASKIAGILLALPAVYLTARQKQQAQVQHNLFWPLVLFVGSGLLDTSLKFVQCNFLSDSRAQDVFSIYTFGVAALSGIALTAVLVALKKIVLKPRNILAGICIGIPNFFSIYFLIRTLDCGFLQSSAAIPTINISILVLSTFIAIIFFRERANAMRITGLVLAIIAILLIALGD